jgi:hypothetical protein
VFRLCPSGIRHQWIFGHKVQGPGSFDGVTGIAWLRPKGARFPLGFPLVQVQFNTLAPLNMRTVSFRAIGDGQRSRIIVYSSQYLPPPSPVCSELHTGAQNVRNQFKDSAASKPTFIDWPDYLANFTPSQVKRRPHHCQHVDRDGWHRPRGP